jgi:hypothetical protein
VRHVVDPDDPLARYLHLLASTLVDGAAHLQAAGDVEIVEPGGVVRRAGADAQPFEVRRSRRAFHRPYADDRDIRKSLSHLRLLGPDASVGPAKPKPRETSGASGDCGSHRERGVAHVGHDHAVAHG